MYFTQSQRSIGAIVLFIAFAVTGKLFVWKTPDKPQTTPSDPGTVTADSLPAETTVTSVSGLTLGTPAASSGSTTTTASVTSSTTLIALTTASGGQAAVSSLTAQSTAASTVSLSSVTSSAVSSTSSTASTVSLTQSSSSTTQTELQTTEAPVGNGVAGMVPAPAGYFDDALFIGDSRTVGQAYYGPIDGATYFASTGMSTANIGGSVSEVSATQGMDFASALSARQYGKVYVMLGINELGNDFDATMQNFRNLLQQIQSAQPGAIIYIEANLHVTAARSAQNVYGVNNDMINRFNAQYKTMADNRNIFYIDVNPLFDDASGALAEEYTRDGVHPIASNYPTWATWLKSNVIVR